jgi:outer membrane protein OmpA-like peptidoglycan-associated protein/tetratricopeptide (TPR) repeat protein
MYKKIFNLLLLMVLLLSLEASGQQEAPSRINVIPEQFIRIHQAGEVALLQKKYSQALTHFRKVLKKYPGFAPSLRSAGACHEMRGNYVEACKYYLEAVGKNPRFSRAIYYETGKMLYQTGRYREALRLFESFDSLRIFEPQFFAYNGMEEQSLEKNYYQQLPASIAACKTALDSTRYWGIKAVRNLGGQINSSADEYFPCLTNDGNTMYYTRRKNEQSDEDLFVSSRPKGDWRSGEALAEFNSNQNEGMVTLVRDGRLAFFTACQRPEVLGACDIWEADIVSGQLIYLRSTEGDANSPGWESQASISCDGSVLYFSSNRSGGFGGADIWVSFRRDDGSWGRPQNAGPNINTLGDEESPFITNDGNTLYFSSTGHLGYGEQDVFMSRLMSDGDWGQAVNLGPPVNSSYRELGFFLSADGKSGFFASNRQEGFGGMDIYEFSLPEQLYSEPITYVEGYVKDSISHQPVKTVVHFQDRPPVETDEAGRFFLCVKAPDTLRLLVNAQDYHPYANKFGIPLWDNRAYFHLNLLLDPLFKLPTWQGEMSARTTEPTINPAGSASELRLSLLFDFDKADLKPEDFAELDKFLDQLRAANLVENVEIIGYADEIGRDSYNLKLSEKRAKNVGVYMKEKGVQVKKIFIEGKGETRNGQPNWKNRRVEIIARTVDY